MLVGLDEGKHLNWVLVERECELVQKKRMAQWGGCVHGEQGFSCA